MPISLEWANKEKTVMWVRVTGRWTWQEASSAWTELHQYVNQVDGLVNFIVIYENDNWLPGDYRDNMIELVSTTPPNLGTVVFVSNNILFEQLFRLFVTLKGGVPFEYAYVRSVDDAQNLLLQPAGV
jgi:hypothetical protein